MTAFQIVAVACLFAIGAQALVTPHDYHSKILLSDDDCNKAFEGMDVYGTDKQICEQDLKHHYYHPKVAHNHKRFIEWIDSDDADKTVNPGELRKFLQKQIVTLAVHECSFVRSPSLKSLCFCDQTLTYVALCMDYNTVNAFFNKIEKPNDNDEEIDLAEMQEYLTKINAASDLKFCEADVKNMMLEIGGSDHKISAVEWKEYLTQEELHDDFRVCRTKLVQETCEVQYNHDCMMMELLEFTMNHLTEKDIEDTFHVFDKNTNGYIEEGEIKNGIPDADEPMTQMFIKMMDKATPTDGKISYAEFRLFMRDHWVQIEMEKGCSTKKQTQEDEVKCYVGKVKELVVEKYARIWMGIVDLDMVITFEHLDQNDNGRIEKDEDLIKGMTWSEDAANNFIAEMDGPDKNVHVSLEEFNEETDEPHMVYGLGDCMDHILEEKPKRTLCYSGELEKMLEKIMHKDVVVSFFKFYDTNNCGRITMDEVKAKNVEDEDVINFMQEMAMGDEKVSLREFQWYVKQQRITAMFAEKKCGTEPANLHPVLLEYHENVFTEYDTQEVFKGLDTDHDHELTSNDCAGHDPLKHKSLLERIDRPDDHDKNVNFLEFWIYMNTPMGPQPRKTQMETKCTIPNKAQVDEMSCYMEHIWNVQ